MTKAERILAERSLSSLLYRFRGPILGAMAVVLVAVPPSLFPKSFYINECFGGILIAIPLYVMSTFLRVRTRQFIGEHTRGNVHAADSLVTCGPYSRVRHPLYVSNTGFAVGITCFHLGVSFWVLPFMLAVVAFEVALSKIEDRFLEQKFGDSWRAWASKTPAFFPRLWTSRFSLGKEPNTPNNSSCCDSKHVRLQRSFCQAFFADSSTWFWLLFCNFLLVLIKVVAFYD